MVINRRKRFQVFMNDLFDASNDPYNLLLIDSLHYISSEIQANSEYEANALDFSLDKAKCSARQNPGIAARYCRELDWSPGDLAVMMVMQCALSAATSGKYLAARGILSSQGDGFRVVVKQCLQILVERERITQQIADIELRELDADVKDTEPST